MRDSLILLVQDIFSQYISLQDIFFPSKAICRIFVSEITHWGGGGGGVWVIWFGLIFFPKLYSQKCFAQQVVFVPVCAMRDSLIFLVQDIFSQCISLQDIFFPSKAICRIFVSKITHTPSPPSKNLNGRPLISSCREAGIIYFKMLIGALKRRRFCGHRYGFIQN